MIWCFGFFFFWLLCDCDEESQKRFEMLRMMTMVTKTVQRPDTHSIFSYERTYAKGEIVQINNLMEDMDDA